MKRDHQKYIRECLAQAIFHKVLDMEVQVFTIFLELIFSNMIINDTSILRRKGILPVSH